MNYIVKQSFMRKHTIINYPPGVKYDWKQQWFLFRASGICLQVMGTSFYRPQGKVMFSEASVSHSVHNRSHGYSVTAHPTCRGTTLNTTNCEQGPQGHLPVSRLSGLPH